MRATRLIAPGLRRPCLVLDIILNFDSLVLNLIKGFVLPIFENVFRQLRAIQSFIRNLIRHPIRTLKRLPGDLLRRGNAIGDKLFVIGEAIDFVRDLVNHAIGVIGQGSR